MTSNLCFEYWGSNEVGHKHLVGHCTSWKYKIKKHQDLWDIFQSLWIFLNMWTCSYNLAKLKIGLYQDQLYDINWSAGVQCGTAVRVCIEIPWILLVIFFSLESRNKLVKLNELCCLHMQTASRPNWIEFILLHLWFGQSGLTVSCVSL
jgi:hypothetical protein